MSLVQKIANNYTHWRFSLQESCTCKPGFTNNKHVFFFTFYYGKIKVIKNKINGIPLWRSLFCSHMYILYDDYQTHGVWNDALCVCVCVWLTVLTSFQSLIVVFPVQSVTYYTLVSGHLLAVRRTCRKMRIQHAWMANSKIRMSDIGTLFAS